MIQCPRCQGKGNFEIKDHRRFFRCYECGYYDYAKIAMQKSQKKINDEFFKMYTEEMDKLPDMGTNLKLI